MNVEEERIREDERQCMATNRYKDQQYRKLLEEAWEFQDFICAECAKIGIFIHCFQSKQYQNQGEGITGIEIKLDKKMESGNLYIEFCEKKTATNKDYANSGVFRDDNTWLWIIGDYKKVFFFSHAQLKQVVKETQTGKYPFRQVENRTGTSHGILLPISHPEVERLIIRTIVF